MRLLLFGNRRKRQERDQIGNQLPILLEPRRLFESWQWALKWAGARGRASDGCHDRIQPARQSVSPPLPLSLCHCSGLPPSLLQLSPAHFPRGADGRAAAGAKSPLNPKSRPALSLSLPRLLVQTRHRPTTASGVRPFTRRSDRQNLAPARATTTLVQVRDSSALDAAGEFGGRHRRRSLFPVAVAAA